MTLNDLTFHVFYADGDWVCVADQFPSYSWTAPTPEEALAQYVENYARDFS